MSCSPRGTVPSGAARVRLLGEAVERLAVLSREALRELEILGAASPGRIREARAERAHILIVERVARAKVVGDLPDELVGDALGAHVSSVGATTVCYSSFGVLGG